MRRILIVEDDKFLSAIFALFIKDMGYELTGRCGSGTEALELCAVERPDVVLMDIHLDGEMDGIQTAEKIQRNLEIPVIFVSSDTSSVVVERAIVSNSYGYLVKPVQKKELAITIDLAYYKHKAVMDQKRREERFRKFLSDAPVPLVILEKGRIQYLNIEALKLFHTHYIEDMIGLPFQDFVGKDFQDAFATYLNQEVLSGKLPQRLGIQVCGLHGKPLDVAISASWISFNGKQALQLVLNDITAERVAVRSCNLFRSAIFGESEGIMVVNHEGQIVGQSPGFKTVLPQIAVGGQLSAWLADFAPIQKLIEGEEGGTTQVELLVARKTFPCEASAIGRNFLGNREILLRLLS
ncbi:response regulator [Geofilum rhodophaeum]|uniref:response regulator n=1 Tax=Geofilum rhodophaeum TaxID=1965019 RepID=UPI000B523E13|nr:response regulator [Geofilum rhodophaeum]